MHSKIALKLYAAVNEGIIKSNAEFWRNFPSKMKIEELNVDIQKYQESLKNANFNVVCCFDDDFPNVDRNVKWRERPFLFVYRGEIDLLKNIDKNIAIVGCLTTYGDIVQRERKIVADLVGSDLNIVSGLASGCDTIAHQACIEKCGKTIAFLPTPLNSVYPRDNKILADEIVRSGGLIITEYVAKPKNRSETIKRFIERDRLQAMFSKAVVLIASFKKGEGDSGSRHAMQKAKEYGHKRYVMFNEKTDKEKSIFGLNLQFLEEGATLLTQ